jgi:hypothetical protein
VLRDDGWVFVLGPQGNEVCRGLVVVETSDIDAAVKKVACVASPPSVQTATGTPQWIGFSLELGEPATSVASLGGAEALALQGGDNPRAWIRHQSGWSEAPRIALPLMGGFLRAVGSQYEGLRIDQAVTGKSRARILARLYRSGCCSDPGESATVGLELLGGRWQGDPNLSPFFKQHPHRRYTDGNLSHVVTQGDDLLSCSVSLDDEPELSGDEAPGFTACLVQKQGKRTELPKAPLRATDAALLAGTPCLVGLGESRNARALRFDGRSWVDMKLPEFKCGLAAFATGPKDLWVAASAGSEDLHCNARNMLLRWDGQAWTRFASPLTKMTGLWGSTPDDVWVAGDKGLAHFDGQAWRLVLDVPGPCHALSGDGTQSLWAACDTGVWKKTGNPPLIEGSSPSAPILTRASWPEKFEPAMVSDHAHPVRRARVPLDGEPPLPGAVGVAEAEDGTVWLLSESRLVELSGPAAKVLAQLPMPSAPGGADVVPLIAGNFTRLFPATPRPPMLVPSAALAPAAAGQGWLLWRGSLWRVKGRELRLEPQQLPDLLALDAHGDTCWMASSSPSWAPKAMVVGPGGPKILAHLPQAAYAAVHATRTDGLWLAGGTGNLDAETGSQDRKWPAGEGVVVHAQGASLREIRIPSGAMLQVRAVGPGEAWAAGVAGTIVHIAGERVTSYAVLPGRLIRSIWAAGPSEVWFAGDMPWLVLWNGRELRRMDLRGELGGFGTVAGIAARGSEPLWVVAPNALLRVERASQSSSPGS